MKAMLWKDWTLFHKNPLYVALSIGIWLFIPMLIAVLSASDPQDSATVDALSMMQLFAPWYGYLATELALCTLMANPNSMDVSDALERDGTVENWRDSGRSMLQYCIAKSLFPALLAEIMSLSVLGYLTWARLTHWNHDSILSLICVIIAPAIVTFAGEQILLASHAATASSFCGVTILSSLPMLLFMAVSYASDSVFWALAAMLALGLLAVMLSIISAHYRYPTTLNAIASHPGLH